MKIEEQGFIFDSEKAEQGKRVCIFTGLFKHSTGRIFSTFRIGSKKDSTDGNGVIAEFVDGKWEIIFSSFQSEFDGKKGDIKAVELFERPDGGLSCLLSWFDCSKSSKLYDAASDTILPGNLIIADSSDMGKTWTNYRIVDTKDLPGPALTGPVLKLPGGYLVFFESYGREKNGEVSCHAARALFSKDGIDFHKIITVAKHPENTLYYWDQRNTFDWCSGKIISMFWTYNRKEEKDIDIHIAHGDPESLTWSIPVSTGIEGQIATPVSLGDGRILCFYVHRHHPGSMRLIISEDNGKTWEHNQELIVYLSPTEKSSSEKSSYAQYWEDMNKWNFGHPSGILFDRNRVLLAYYAGIDASSLSARYCIISI
ncbi:MAG: glycoside hydrolase [Candidatus Omnitrophica bacterium]|nr:glycoside hydrolase [Candidatus Omnitrophota bacterium]